MSAELHRHVGQYSERGKEHSQWRQQSARSSSASNVGNLETTSPGRRLRHYVAAALGSATPDARSICARGLRHLLGSAVRSGRIEAQTGLRMMPTFPRYYWAQNRKRVLQALEHVRQAAMRFQTPKVGAACGNFACADLCGGRPVTAVPTANLARTSNFGRYAGLRKRSGSLADVRRDPLGLVAGEQLGPSPRPPSSCTRIG
jgi:hypothetical protein